MKIRYTDSCEVGKKISVRFGCNSVYSYVICTLLYLTNCSMWVSVYPVNSCYVPSRYRFCWFLLTYTKVLRWFPSSKSVLHTSHATSWFKFIKIKTPPSRCNQFFKKLHFAVHKKIQNASVPLSRNSKIFTIVTSSILYYSYQKDERANPDNPVKIIFFFLDELKSPCGNRYFSLHLWV
jgi:hypothetical protein